MRRFSAKLLFQYMVTVDGNPGKRRICEERIVSFKAKTAAHALRAAKSKGKKSQHRGRNEEGHDVFFEFLGVMELLHLGPECGTDETWYDVKEYLLPKERRDRLIPAERELQAIQEFQSRRRTKKA